MIAAGNTGPDAGSVGTPGAADAALTVAAVDDQDEIASFSSRGPRFGDKAMKPDIAAPGVNIVAARAAGTTMGTPACRASSSRPAFRNRCSGSRRRCGQAGPPLRRPGPS
ncbi:S8 family serine peptidase [Streptomyces sp. NBC_01022]|nr:S8 family serine peptidase [Streptomyces sp. NBC_01022]WRZ80235.1 S8 family serine peptidase [Streptomyces sp. NBC_01022]